MIQVYSLLKKITKEKTSHREGMQLPRRKKQLFFACFLLNLLIGKNEPAQGLTLHFPKSSAEWGSVGAPACGLDGTGRSLHTPDPA